MTRKEFSDRLVECRVEANCGKNELCRRTGFTFNQLQRLENASNNYSIDNILLYLKAIGYGIYTFMPEKKHNLFDNRENFSSHFRMYRKNLNMSLREFASFSGLSLTTVSGIERATKNTAIDSLLICLEKLNCKLEIRKL